MCTLQRHFWNYCCLGSSYLLPARYMVGGTTSNLADPATPDRPRADAKMTQGMRCHMARTFEVGDKVRYRREVKGKQIPKGTTARVVFVKDDSVRIELDGPVHGWEDGESVFYGNRADALADITWATDDAPEPTMEKINLTPVGVQKDPARVNAAVSAFDTCNANARDTLKELLRMLDFQVTDQHRQPVNDPEWAGGRGWIRPDGDGRMVEVHGEALDAFICAKLRIDECDATQEEMLRAISGHPPVGGGK